MSKQQSFIYVAYEREDLPDSTGQVCFVADTMAELAARAHISLDFIRDEVRGYRRRPRTGRNYSLANRAPYEVRKVYLN